MTAKIRVFISSVQKELEHERVALSSLMTTDPFLMQHCVPVLFEKEPIPARPSTKPFLDCLKSCHVYVLLIFNDYGRLDGGLSATHSEYRLAHELKLPTLVFIKGTADDMRQLETKALINEIKKHKHTYRRFIDREDLKPEVRYALVALLKREFALKASADEVAGGRELIEAASTFESKPLTDVSWSALDRVQIARFAEAIGASPDERTGKAAGLLMHARGLLWRDDSRKKLFATAGSVLLFAPRPADSFPQAEILVDAYSDTKVSGKPRGQLNINAPIPIAIEHVLEFVDKHTFHPTRIVGINNITLDEYSRGALREALVNAVAHRNYDDASRKVTVQVFSDRVVISSPGYPPAPLTLAKLRKGNYRPCSRNPVIAQALATLKLMEQRGSGFARMRDAMLDHGLDAPTFAEQDGYFVVTFPGPNGNYDRLKAPESTVGLITPAVEAQLNKRQRRIMKHVLENGSVTTGWCMINLRVVRDTAHRDLLDLVELNLLVRKGAGRGATYVLKEGNPGARII